MQTVPGIDGGTSDVLGMATITFPAHCHDELTTGTVIVMVEHPEFCGTQVEGERRCAASPRSDSRYPYQPYSLAPLGRQSRFPSRGHNERQPTNG